MSDKNNQFQHWRIKQSHQLKYDYSISEGQLLENNLLKTVQKYCYEEHLVIIIGLCIPYPKLDFPNLT